MKKIQIGPDRRLKVKAGKVLLASDGQACCCGEDDGPPYVRVVDCCNRLRSLWVLQSMVGGCTTIQRVGGLGTVECWTVDPEVEPMTAAEIRANFPDEGIDSPDTTTPFPCGTCGIAPCPTCPDCCMALTVYPACGVAVCCNVGRAYRVRYDITLSWHKRWIPQIFFAPDCGGLLATADMYVDSRAAMIARGSWIVTRPRRGNTCDPPVAVCEGASVRRIRHQDEPNGASVLTGCTITTPPRVVTIDEDNTENECLGSPFDMFSFDFGVPIGPQFNDYGVAIPNVECSSDGQGGLWPYSGSWSATANDPFGDYTSSASYSRSLAKSCGGTLRSDDYSEVYAWTQLPSLEFTATGTQRTTVSIEILDADCGSDPCPPPGGGGGLLGELRRTAGTLARPSLEAYLPNGLRETGTWMALPGMSKDTTTRGGCAGCGSNAGVRLATPEEMRQAIALIRMNE